MKLSKQNFGEMEGRDIDLCILGNDSGMIVKIMNYGATITSILVPGKFGKTEDIVCGFDSLGGFFLVLFFEGIRNIFQEK